ncbi:MAG: hypothetical protein AAFV53_15495 [Myxococcota bacterium]
MLIAFTLTLILGCDNASETPANPTPSTTPTPAAQPAATQPAATVSTVDPAAKPTASGGGGGALPNVGDNLRHGLCANGPGSEGADSYFVGAFSISGNNVTGSEKWQLFANPKWQARGGRDCSIEWSVRGTTADTGACGNCDLGVRFHATANVAGSNCPEELVRGRINAQGRRVGGEANDFDQHYAIQRRADGSAKIFFAKSGKLLAEGYYNEGGFNYVTDHACKWF